MRACRSGRDKVRTKNIARMKGGRIAMITAYDYPTAIIADEAGVDVILVGDSLGMVVLGEGSTLTVSLEDMKRHTRAVAKSDPCALIVADMPFMSYETGVRDAVLSAGELVRAGAEAVKLEGGSEMADVIKAIVRAGIPVMGHIGMTPQRMHVIGGYRRVGKKTSEARKLLEDAVALEEAGVFAVVLEFMRADIAKRITEKLGVPTICIGAGPHCDGQVLVFHDVVGLSTFTPPFAKRYIDGFRLLGEAVAEYVEEVKQGKFPSKDHYK